MIEIDITYLCNLSCFNCNRSVRQAPEALHLPLDGVTAFVEQSLARGKRWRRIRVLGGEPTLHPAFFAIIEELRRYRRSNPECIIEVVTNGHEEAVRSRLARLPADIWVENSAKTSDVQPTFGPFNLAPVDDPAYRHADFRNGCAIMRDCGMGLTPLGYFPCAVAGGVTRITGEGGGRTELPTDDDEMEDLIERNCRLCGRFRDGHYVPTNIRPTMLEERMSPSWIALYRDWWRKHKPGRQLPAALAGEAAVPVLAPKASHLEEPS
ncbi:MULTISPECIES: radical SAM protein [Myxococcus]|uniref:radical SAM protein n=1 Tax=Myxococcus TaxID=32 RepID=UPI00157BB201|nr:MULTISPECIES: radical SAM protein [Myxococcus]NTX08789.1 radical SAM protein [Myxococcus sp. CA040A]